MSMTRTPPAKPRQTRARAAQQSADNGSLRPCASFEDRTKNVDDDSRSAVSNEACGINGKNSKFKEGKTTDESVPPSSSPLVALESKSVGRLDTNVFKPFGVANSSISLSRSSSDTSTSDNADESAICQGGPGKFNCGVQVADGDNAVQCDKCKRWFHIKCQSIPEPAHEALVKYECLSWLCGKCKPSIENQVGDSTCKEKNGLALLEKKVQEISEALRQHTTTIAQSLKDQEKVASEHFKLLEKVSKDQWNQKTSYADIVRGSCDKVIKEVGAKFEMLPSKVVSKDATDTTMVMTKVFDSFLDKEKRKLNVVVHNLPEDESATLAQQNHRDQEMFTDVVKEGLKLVTRPTRSFRVGKKLEGKPRLLIVTLENSEIKAELLRLAPQLRHLTTWTRIYITPDLPKKEREENRKLREELFARRQAGEENITIRRGKIIKLPEARSAIVSDQQSQDTPNSKESKARDHDGAATAHLPAQGGGGGGSPAFPHAHSSASISSGSK